MEVQLTTNEFIFTLFTALFTTLVWMLICIAPTVIVIIVIIKLIRKSKKEDIEMFNKASELTEKRLNKDLMESIPKKIVRCEFCGKQTRFGDGICPTCGASLSVTVSGPAKKKG